MYLRLADDFVFIVALQTQFLTSCFKYDKHFFLKRGEKTLERYTWVFWMHDGFSSPQSKIPLFSPAQFTPEHYISVTVVYLNSIISVISLFHFFLFQNPSNGMIGFHPSLCCRDQPCYHVLDVKLVSRCTLILQSLFFRFLACEQRVPSLVKLFAVITTFLISSTEFVKVLNETLMPR